jgi:hypothetical protein
VLNAKTLRLKKKNNGNNPTPETALALDAQGITMGQICNFATIAFFKGKP